MTGFYGRVGVIMGPPIAILTLCYPLPAHAQFAPQVQQYPNSTVTVTSDPNNPSSVTITRIDKNSLSKRVDHYYFDCLKKKWVWVSRDWYRAPRGFESGDWTLTPPPKPEYAGPDTKQLSSGPPPGAETSADDPDRAYNPTTGQNFVKEKDGSWIDVKTGKTEVAPKLCPPCPEPATTPQPPPPKMPKGAENTVCPETKRTAMGQPPS